MENASPASREGRPAHIAEKAPAGPRPDNNNWSITDQAMRSSPAGRVVGYHPPLERADRASEISFEPLTVGNIIINQESWNTLDELNWLDDCVIDAALLASSAYARNDTAVFSVHAMKQMYNLSCTRWMTEMMRAQYSLHAVNTWLVPFNTIVYNGCAHWALFVVSLNMKRIVLIDSLLPAKAHTRAVEDILALVTLSRGPQTWAGWKLVFPDEQTKQLDSSSCGLFVTVAGSVICSGKTSPIPASFIEQTRYMRNQREKIKQQLLHVSFIFY